MTAVIAANHLTIRFGAFTAVDDVSFDIAKGELFGFLGPNGSGKTTIIKALCGLLPPSEGTGHILGMDIRKDAAEIRRHVGYMSQKFGLYEDLTVAENMNFYAGVYGLSADRAAQRTRELQSLTGIEPYMNRRAGQLSGGWKQRLALACSIIHSPEVVFLDEPTAGIDPVARRALWDLLFQLSGQGVTFFVTTHYMDEAERCSHLAYIYYGKLIADGTPDTLREIPEVRPPGTHRFEISTKDVTTALRKARKLPFMRSATIFGRSIHALMDDKITEQELTRELDNIGVHPDEIRPLAPDLEDVFVELTYKHQAEREAASGQSV
jgi:ABC-2 type transport system ATP-binding protein